ncbi:MAG: peptidylprolyl isomerase [Hyphomonadaceae bacterium]
MIRTLILGSAMAGVLAFGALSVAQDEAPTLGDIVDIIEADSGDIVDTVVEGDTANSALISAAKADPTNWRKIDASRLMVFETTKGRIIIEAFAEFAPLHVAQYSAIVRSGDYNGTSFHRVIDGFMAQGGDVFAFHGRESGLPNIPAEFTFRRDPAVLSFDMLGDPNRATEGYYLGLPMRTESKWLAELNKDGLVESSIPHCQGVVSSARLGDDRDSANAQFFLLRAHSDWLDKEYSPWGRIVDGQDVVQALKIGEPVVNPDILTRAYIVADLPEAEQVKVWVARTDGPDFAETLASNPDTHVCDLPAVTTLVEG